MACHAEKEETGVRDTPTRPPNYRSGRRKPKGHRPVPRPTREQIALAADRLDASGYPDSASVVRSVIEPGGWNLLSASSQQSSNLALTIDEKLKFELRAAALKMQVSLSLVVEEGYQAVLDGEWMPHSAQGQKQAASRRVRDAHYVRSVLNVRVGNELRESVRAMLPVLSERAGFKVTESSIAVQWMMDELGVSHPGDHTAVLPLQVRKSLRDYWVERAEQRQVSFQSIVEDGFRAVLDGSWDLGRVKPTRTYSQTDPNSKLTIRVNDALLEQVADASPDIAEQLRRAVTPMILAMSILKDRLGEPAE
jgi:hypothetical protein